MTYSLAIVVAGWAAGWIVGSPALVAALPLAAGCSWHWRVIAGQTALRARAGDQTIEIVQGLIQQLKGGRSLAQSLGSMAPARRQDPRMAPAGPLVPVLARLRAALDAGTGLDSALARAAGWAPLGGRTDPGLALTLATLRVLVQRGGEALPALERLDDTLRSAQWVEQETRIQAGQATASALVLAGLPALFAAALMLLDPDLARFYCFEPLGAVCLVGSWLLSYLGWWWMHRVIWRTS